MKASAKEPPRTRWRARSRPGLLAACWRGRRQSGRRRPARCLALLWALAACEGVVLGAGSPALTNDGFRVPEPGTEFRFPADHGAHPAFKIEWWYVTGHLRSGDRRFGLQATFFRFGLAPSGAESWPAPSAASITNPETPALRAPAFGTNQLYLAHMALTDVANRSFVYEERLNRAGWDAWAATGDLDLRNGNWTLRRVPRADAADRLELRGSVQAQARFELDLVPAKPLVVFGEGGVSRKGAAATAASYYLTWPRLAVSGRLEWRGAVHEIKGTAWLDHEISSSQLDSNQVGWDWAGIRLDDGRDLMVYVMRQSSGEPDAHSTLAWVDRAGRVMHQRVDQFAWAPIRRWQSPRNPAEYPVESRLTTVDPETGQRVTLHLEPLVDDQEIGGELGGIAYWEGACAVRDAGGRPIGEAYVELTGYDGRLHRRLR